jgi:hypothetical protein
VDEEDEFDETEFEIETEIGALEEDDSSFSGKEARIPMESGGPKGEALRWWWWWWRWRLVVGMGIASGEEEEEEEGCE